MLMVSTISPISSSHISEKSLDFSLSQIDHGQGAISTLTPTTNCRLAESWCSTAHS